MQWILFFDRELDVRVLVSSRSEHGYDGVLVIGQQYVASIVQLDYQVVGGLVRTELQVNNSVGAQLGHIFEASTTQMLSQLAEEINFHLVVH